MKWKLSFLHLQDLLKVINNVFYHFSISHLVLKLFKFVWYVNDINYDVKLCTDNKRNLFRIPTSPKCFSVGSCKIMYNTVTDRCKLLENRGYLRDYWTKSLKILQLNVSQHTEIKQDQLSFIKPKDIPIKYYDLCITLRHRLSHLHIKQI